MADEQNVTRDLHFVRAVVQGAGRPGAPPATYVILAFLILIGFPLPNFVSQPAVLGYWAIAGPLGFLAAALVSARHGHRMGQHDTQAGRQHALHWAIMFIVAGLLLFLPVCGLLEWTALPPLVLLIVSLTYLLAAVHMDRRFVWPGALFALGYGLLLAGVPFAWTILGALTALALLACAWNARAVTRVRDARDG
jgi:hypothetical protein